MNYKTAFTCKVFICIMLCFNLIGFSALYAQSQLNFQHLTIEDGLSNNLITDIVQDSTGFIWIGTDDGLNRYDGYDIDVYSFNPNDSNSISDNGISSLAVDGRGKLWIGTRHGGLNSFQKIDQTFQRHLSKDLGNNEKIEYIKTLYFENDSLLWACGPGKAIRFNVNSLKVDKVITSNKIQQQIPGFERFVVESIKIDQNNNIWFCLSEGRVLKTDKTCNTFKLYDFSTLLNTKLGLVHSMLFDNKGNVWAGTQKGLIKMDTVKNSTIRYVNNNENSIANNDVEAIFQNGNDNIWIGTRNGINIFDHKTETFELIKQIDGDKNSLNNNKITSFFEDQNKIIWVGTYGERC